MERYINILNNHLSSLSASNIDFLEKRINDLNIHTPWLFYVKFAGVVIGIITAVFTQLEKSDLKFINMKNSFKIWISYLLLIVAGPFGAHQIYLRRKNHALFYTISTLTFLVLNFNLFYLFFNHPDIILDIHSYTLLSKLILFSIGSLLCLDVILIPFFTYRQNNNIYKKHFETDLILGNKYNSIDYHLKEQSNIMKSIKASYEDIKIVLDDNSIREEISGGIGGFFKNIATLGKSNALNREIGRLKTLQSTAVAAQTNLQNALEYHKNAEELLYSCRTDVYRNLYLAKELVSLIKNVISKENTLVTDDVLTFEMQNIKAGNTEIKITAFNDQMFIKNIQSNFANSFSKFQDKNVELNKINIINSSVDAAVNVIENLFIEIGKLNKEVSAKRLEVGKAHSQISDALIQTNKTFVGIEGNILRINEIIKALNTVNKSFIKRYEPMRLKVFEDSSVKSYLTQGSRARRLKGDRELWNDIKILLFICQEYNKINQAKVL